MNDRDEERSGSPGAGLPRRERLERIAGAERDRRAGRSAIAVASIGEASEWPARAVLALARLDEEDPSGAAWVLEAGLDQWAREHGLAPLDRPPGATDAEVPTPPTTPPLPLEGALEPGELDRAFAEAEAQIEEMHDVNSVAARVLMDEPLGLSELSGEEALGGMPETELQGGRDPGPGTDMDAAVVEAAPSSADAGREDERARPSRVVILATLERWLRNLERRRAGGMR